MKAFLKFKELQLKTVGASGRMLREVAGEVVPDCFGRVEANGKLGNTFDQKGSEKNDNLLIDCEPFIMFGIWNRWSRLGFGGSELGGGR